MRDTRSGDAGTRTRGTAEPATTSVYAQPLVTAKWVTAHLDVTATTADNMLDRLSAAGVLRETTGKKRYRKYRYDRYVELFEKSAAAPDVDETVS